jgi:ERCC4-type nuclease
MKLVIDNREHKLIKLLKALNNDYDYKLDIEVQKLDLGDVSIQSDEGEELLLIERKNLADLASSKIRGTAQSRRKRKTRRKR